MENSNVKKPKIYFASSNVSKYQEIVDIMKEYEVKMLVMEIPEIQNVDVVEVVRQKIKYASKKHPDLDGILICEDTGLDIEDFGKWPGAFIKMYFNDFGAEGVVARHAGSRATLRSAIGIYMNNVLQEPLYADLHGRISIRTYQDTSTVDTIFIPNPTTSHENREDLTLADMTLLGIKNTISHRCKSLEKLMKQLQKTNDLNEFATRNGSSLNEETIAAVVQPKELSKNQKKKVARKRNSINYLNLIYVFDSNLNYSF